MLSQEARHWFKPVIMDVCLCVCLYGVCVCVAQGWLLQTIPLKVVYAESMLLSLQDYVKKMTEKRKCNFWNQ